ncbi:hypothetical protein Nepgr_018594 [Nepenthes gracilis]|uniref:RRM domain-containing protein n=1 Tax=Nepenthes gracilis TaxID=150966 RepID=A0AAD3XTJ6_NEPGR|nr:hypothetical protein Nepgr_018594 [Nepenthes gracilis]
MSAASIKPLYGTLTMSPPIVLNSKALYSCLFIPSKSIKLHLSLSLSSPQIPLTFLQKKRFYSSIVSHVSYQEEQGGVYTALQDIQQEELNLGFDNPESNLSDWEASGGDEQAEVAEESGDEGFGVASEGEEGGFPEPPEEAKLFVGNLPYDVDSEKLAQLLEPAGVVEIAEVIYNRDTDQSRGFGFVTMSTVEEADKAVEMFNRYDFNGRLLTVNKAAPRGSRPTRAFEPSLRIYVGNLPWNVDSERLGQVFREFGQVVEARVVYDRETGRSRGFGFVTMASEAEMNDAIAALDGQTLDGRAVRRCGISVAQISHRLEEEEDLYQRFGEDEVIANYQHVTTRSEEGAHAPALTALTRPLAYQGSEWEEKAENLESELQQCYKAQSRLSEQLVVEVAECRAAKSLAQEKESVIADLQKEVAQIRDECSELKMLLEQKSKALELAVSENQELKGQLVEVTLKAKNAESENKMLIDRWMLQKMQDAERLNEANALYRDMLDQLKGSSIQELARPTSRWRGSSKRGRCRVLRRVNSSHFLEEQNPCP